MRKISTSKLPCISKYADFLQDKGNLCRNPLWISSELPAVLQKISAFETVYP